MRVGVFYLPTDYGSSDRAPLRRIAGEREGASPKGWGGEVALPSLSGRGATHLTPVLSPRKRAETEWRAA
jgi:hypothetical protein